MRDGFYLAYILERINRIESYIAGGRETFIGSILVQDAVLRSLHVLCESALRLSDSAKAACPNTDWQQLRGFRINLVHKFVNINLDTVCDIITDHLPVLKGEILALMPDDRNAT